MRTFTIIGSRPVAGRPTGHTVSQDDLTGCNIPALIQGGHLTENPTKAPQAETTEEE